MKFRKQLVKRMFNHICYTFRLEAVTDVSQLNGRPKPPDVDELVIKFYRGLMPDRLRPRFVYLNHLRYNGYGGHIFVGHRQIQIARSDTQRAFRVRNLHPRPIDSKVLTTSRIDLFSMFLHADLGIKGNTLIPKTIKTKPILPHRSPGLVTIRGKSYAIAPYFRHLPKASCLVQ